MKGFIYNLLLDLYERMKIERKYEKSEIDSNPATLCFWWGYWGYFAASRVASRAGFQSGCRRKVIVEYDR